VGGSVTGVEVGASVSTTGSDGESIISVGAGATGSDGELIISVGAGATGSAGVLGLSSVRDGVGAIVSTTGSAGVLGLSSVRDGVGATVTTAGSAGVLGLSSTKAGVGDVVSDGISSGTGVGAVVFNAGPKVPCTTGVGAKEAFGSGHTNIWPVLIWAGVALIGPVQLKSPAMKPFPCSCNEFWAELFPNSRTPMSLDDIPAAAPSVAVIVCPQEIKSKTLLS